MSVPPPTLAHAPQGVPAPAPAEPYIPPPGSRGAWMLTASGGTVDLDLMLPESLRIEDVAYHLARLPRFNGATRGDVWWSVAQHCLLVEWLLMKGGCNARVRMAGLLHDAHEAYTGDVSTPMKCVVGPAWDAAEGRIAHAVRTKLGVADLFEPSTLSSVVIRHADHCSLAAERVALMHPGGPAWDYCLEGITPQPELLAEALPRITCWHEAKEAFLDRYHQLRRRMQHEATRQSLEGRIA